jgi:glucuronate isomerase
MEDYLLDRETLGQFVDELIKKRPLPVDNAEEINNYREEQMRALDDHITNALFGQMNEEQATALSQLLDQEKENPDVFKNFFTEQNINVEQIVADAANSFSANYLAGGQNV